MVGQQASRRAYVFARPIPESPHDLPEFLYTSPLFYSVAKLPPVTSILAKIECFKATCHLRLPGETFETSACNRGRQVQQF